MHIYDVKFAIPILLLIGYLIHLCLSYRRLSHIPGPWLAGWSNLWLVGAVYRKQCHLELYKLAQKYGMSYGHFTVAADFNKIRLLTVSLNRIPRENRTQHLNH
jgi:hypothetical protein